MATVVLSKERKRELVLTWYNEYRTIIYGIGYGIAGAAYAEDVVQHTLLKALEHLDRNPPPARPRAWLCEVATNFAIDEYRRQRRLQWLPSWLPDPRPSSDRRSITAIPLLDALLQLTPEERWIIVQHKVGKRE